MVAFHWGESHFEKKQGWSELKPPLKWQQKAALHYMILKNIRKVLQKTWTFFVPDTWILLSFLMMLNIPDYKSYENWTEGSFRCVMQMRIWEWLFVGSFSSVFRLWQTFTVNTEINHMIKQVHTWTRSVRVLTSWIGMIFWPFVTLGWLPTVVFQPTISSHLLSDVSLWL